MTAPEHTRCTCADEPRQLATTWADAVAVAELSPSGRDGVADRLAVLTADLQAALRAAEFDPSGPEGAGAALVGMHVTEAAALHHTLALLGRRFAACTAHPGGTARTADVLGALAAGFARALRDRTRDEQERITASAFAARAAAEQARWDSEARFQAVFDEAAVGMALCDANGYVLEANRSLRTMLGADPGGTGEPPLWAREHPEDRPDFVERVCAVAHGRVDQDRMEKPLYRADGGTVWTEVVLSLVRHPDGSPRYVVVMVDDVTAYREMRDRLTHQAQHDPLTGLANRTLFFERLHAVLASDAPAGICYLDLDGFKAVNDTLGHDQGDMLLRTVADRLRETLAPGGHVVGRMGGDEFVVLVEHVTDSRQLRAVATTALLAVRRPIRLGGRELVVSASIGTVHRDDGGSDASELMKSADVTMYRAKRSGGDRVASFDDEWHRADRDRSALSSRMPEALARGEFVVDYQPLVRLSDGAVTGVEALVRWVLPSGQTLGPNEFVGVAETTGMIIPLGRSVLYEACRRAAAWRAVDPRVAPLVSVNLAARQLHEPGLLSDVLRILDDTGWPAGLLQLELAEGALTDATTESVATLRGLSEAGVRIAIDDFGTDYSNLAHLRHLPIHGLKLAGPFVTGAPHGTIDVRGGAGRTRDQVDLAVVELVVHLGHVLRLGIAAEWVESEQQCRQLRDLGCDTAQGWYFAPPVGPDAVPDLILDPPWARDWPRSDQADTCTTPAGG